MAGGGGGGLVILYVSQQEEAKPTLQKEAGGEELPLCWQFCEKDFGTARWEKDQFSNALIVPSESRGQSVLHKLMNETHFLILRSLTEGLWRLVDNITHWCLKPMEDGRRVQHQSNKSPLFLCAISFQCQSPSPCLSIQIVCADVCICVRACVR